MGIKNNGDKNNGKNNGDRLLYNRLSSGKKMDGLDRLDGIKCNLYFWNIKQK